MSIFESLEESFKVIIKNPKILLPATLNWLVLSLFLMTFFFFWRYLDRELMIYEKIKSFVLSGDPSYWKDFNIEFLLKNHFNKFILLLIILFTISFIYLSVDIFLSSFYTLVFRQLQTKRDINFDDSILQTRKFFFNLMHVWFLLVGAQLLVSILMFLPLFLTKQMIFLIFILLFFVSIIIFLLCLWITPSVVIYRKLKGLEALKYCLSFVFKNFFKLFLIAVLFLIIRFLVLSSISQTPYIGYFLYLIFDAVFLAWDKLLQASIFRKLS
ncbi:MAG: hypothetical protein RMJ17_04480 [Candidatus Aenigmarchaeota archaeon]|nr:hypothetical protein [Candidatus Aenigmarchaeota archaeon]MDW8149812.1 hypothetical protein [Candidatus Aenigmarchaeota archaeon]